MNISEMIPVHRDNINKRGIKEEIPNNKDNIMCKKGKRVQNLDVIWSIKEMLSLEITVS